MSKPEWQTDAPNKPEYPWDYRSGDDFLLAAASIMLSGCDAQPVTGGLTEFIRNAKRRGKKIG